MIVACTLFLKYYFRVLIKMGAVVALSTLLHFYGDCTIASLLISDVHLVYCEVDMPIGTPSL